MNRAILAELQRLTAYPSVTLLFNTTPGSVLGPTELASLAGLLDTARQRLRGDVAAGVAEEAAEEVMAALESLAADTAKRPATQALALFASPSYSASVQLGRGVEERVTIDDTFTTRDLVADLSRTAVYRVVTVSDRMVRMLVGDRVRLVEQRDHLWPLVRTDDYSANGWKAEVTTRLRAEHGELPVPCVYAGVQRSVRSLTPAGLSTIGVIAGNHDRSPASRLHTAAWPIVSDWLRTDATRAIGQLEVARSTNTFAGGIDEVWPLAGDGRIEVLVVEAGYSLPARVDENNQVQPADDPHARDVHDDIIDDTIETVLLHGGRAVIVEDGVLPGDHRIAAALRY